MIHGVDSFSYTLPRVFEWEGRRFAGEGPPLAEAQSPTK